MTETPTTDEYVSVGDAAKMLGVSVDTMRRYDLPHWTTPGGHRRYRRDDLTRILAERNT